MYKFRNRLWAAFLFLIAASPSWCPAADDAKPAAPPLQLKDGDRVVMIGGTFVERDQAYGYLETAMVSRNPDKNLVFRNLGWSGDTVWGDARANFKYREPNFGFNQLKEMVVANKPTVILVAYGANEAFEGTAGLEKFVKQYNVLLDMLAATKAQIILIAPLAQEKLGPPLPDPQNYNKQLAEYVAAIKKLGSDRSLAVVDIQSTLDGLRQIGGKTPLTDNQIHFHEVGYRVVDELLDNALEVPPNKGINLAKFDELRAAVVAKNRLYFYRWRPQNETYLFGFRKHEQGRNAAEVVQFDPLIAEQEKLIAKLRGSVWHSN